MMFELKTYILYPDKTPTRIDIEQCVDIARMNNCAVMLKWYVKYNGEHHVIVFPDSDAEKVSTDCRRYMEYTERLVTQRDRKD